MKKVQSKKIWLALLMVVTVGLSIYSELRAEDIIVICDPGKVCATIGGKPIDGKLRDIIVVGS